MYIYIYIKMALTVLELLLPTDFRGECELIYVYVVYMSKV